MLFSLILNMPELEHFVGKAVKIKTSQMLESLTTTTAIIRQDANLHVLSQLSLFAAQAQISIQLRLSEM